MSVKILVDKKALRQILIALEGPGYLIRELQVIKSLGGSPISQLEEDYNKSDYGE